MRVTAWSSPRVGARDSVWHSHRGYILERDHCVDGCRRVLWCGRGPRAEKRGRRTTPGVVNTMFLTTLGSRDTGKRHVDRIVCLSSSKESSYSIRIPNGIYLRDDEASTMKNYSRMLGLLKLSGIQRMTAIKLIEGVEVRIDEKQNNAKVKYLTVVPFYNVVEEYRLDGRRTKNGRRDLQPGPMICTAHLKNDLPKESVEGQNMVLRLDMYWERPNPGALLEEMHVVRGGKELVVQSTVKVEDGEETARMVYRKIDGSFTPKYRWNPLEVLSIMNETS